MSKGNLKTYQRSEFIRKTTSQYVDFYVPSRPSLIYLATPKEFFSCVDMRWIGRHIRAPIPNGSAIFSPDQIRDVSRGVGTCLIGPTPTPQSSRNELSSLSNCDY